MSSPSAGQVGHTQTIRQKQVPSENALGPISPNTDRFDRYKVNMS